MGDVADMMLDGTLCEGCGEFLNEDPPGYPCYCTQCATKKLQAAIPPKSKPKVECPICKRKIKGLRQHLWDKHKHRLVQ